MGGIPYQSKGCANCRRRKKRCDLQQPRCGQCLRLSLACGGHRRDAIWVNVTPSTGTPARQQHRQPSNVVLYDSFARSAYRERYLGLFWNSYLPNGRAFPTQTTQYTNGVWTNELHDMFHTANNGTSLRDILLAICFTSVGQRDEKPWVVENGIRLYGKSVAALGQQLGERRASISSYNLATVRLLSLYEILHGHNQEDRILQVRNWNLHISGESGLLIMNGPENYTTGFAHQLFVDGRMTLISSSLVSRTPTFLNAPEWKSTPWRSTPKTAKDLLGDIFAELPGVLAELDDLRCAEDAQAKEMQRRLLLRKCSVLERDWLRWGRESAPERDPVIAPETVPAAQMLDHLVAAHIMSTYWAIGIYLHATLDEVACSGEQALRAIPSDSYDEAMMCCRNILAITPTFLSCHAGEFGVHGAIFGSIVALHYLNSFAGRLASPEERAFRDLFARNANGKIVERFVDNMLQGIRKCGVELFP